MSIPNQSVLDPRLLPPGAAAGSDNGASQYSHTSYMLDQKPEHPYFSNNGRRGSDDVVDSVEEQNRLDEQYGDEGAQER